ncbi:dihydrofolate reductase family protein [Paenibacillus eucommiae]|uniref:Dihydrofolate reductase n=1 Tax=Paenibacillus eucommiae TaxID=1355755 RepID=A0ABS4IQ24_9BACL|nr:dihydrofolate reductase family protein [Paenibacillus eucommiae]MBP1989674.1 dihydrofolate reductase [Paenibacillus eucommiae]
MQPFITLNGVMQAPGDFAQTLMKHHLIDEYRTWVHPVILGRGQRLTTKPTEFIQPKTSPSSL